MAKTTAIRFLFAKGSTDFGGVAIPLTVTITSFFVQDCRRHPPESGIRGGGMNYEVFKDQLTSKEIAELKEFDRRYFTLMRQVRTGKIWEEEIPYSPFFRKTWDKFLRDRGLQKARSKAMKGRQPEGLRRWHERQRLLKANKEIRKVSRAQKKMLALSAGLAEIGRQKVEPRN